MEKIHQWFNRQECVRDEAFKDAIHGAGSGSREQEEKRFHSTER